MSKDEVVELFSGKTVHYSVGAKNLDVIAYLGPAGEARELRGGTKNVHPWWVKKNGAHCIQFSGKKPSCEKIVKRSDRSYVKLRKDKLLIE